MACAAVASVDTGRPSSAGELAILIAVIMSTLAVNVIGPTYRTAPGDFALYAASKVTVPTAVHGYRLNGIRVTVIIGVGVVAAFGGTRPGGLL